MSLVTPREASEVAAARVDRLLLHRLVLPLKAPYKLAFGDVAQFDTIVVEACDETGHRGFGEATILTGYTKETPAESWAAACRAAARMAGRDAAEAKRIAGTLLSAMPFALTALITAIEMLEGHPILAVKRPTRVPLIAIVNETGPAEIEREVEDRLSEGYRTLKVKAGFDADTDLRRVAFIQRTVAGRALLRIDGNQGFDRDTGVRFAAALEPDGIELLEQPCAAGDWAAARAVAEASAVPTMLDESIYRLGDIDRAAADQSARFIKCKLMKMGGLTRLAEGLARVGRNGMTAVLGNGVATDLGCWMEACVAARHVSTAGEMNGFLKPRERLFAKPLEVLDGCLLLHPSVPEIDPAALAQLARESASFPETGAG